MQELPDACDKPSHAPAPSVKHHIEAKERRLGAGWLTAARG